MNDLELENIITKLHKCSLFPKKASKNDDANTRNIIILVRLLNILQDSREQDYDFIDDIQDPKDNCYLQDRVESIFAWINHHFDIEDIPDLIDIIRSMIISITQYHSLSEDMIIKTYHESTNDGSDSFEDFWNNNHQQIAILLAKELTSILFNERKIDFIEIIDDMNPEEKDFALSIYQRDPESYDKFIEKIIRQAQTINPDYLDQDLDLDQLSFDYDNGMSVKDFVDRIIDEDEYYLEDQIEEVKEFAEDNIRRYIKKHSKELIK